MKTKFVLVIVLVLLTGVLAAFMACAKDSGDDDDDDTSLDDFGDDTNQTGDDTLADDTVADDTVDDDTGDDAVSPVLSNGAWDPPAFTWEASCGDPVVTEACTTLTWAVCDPDNNMLPDGQFFIYQAGGTQAFFTGGPAMPISDFNFPTTPDFSDCSAPITFGIGLLVTEDQFGGIHDDYPLAADIEATDTGGNLSNKLTNIEVTITY